MAVALLAFSSSPVSSSPSLRSQKSAAAASGREFGRSSMSSLLGSKTGEFTCGFCEFLLFTIETYVTDGSTEAEITHIVDGICAYIPSEWNETCKELIDEFGPTIITLLVAKENPEEICCKIDLCNTTKCKTGFSAQAKSPPRRPSSPSLRVLRRSSSLHGGPEEECGFCEYLIKKTETFLSSSSSEEEIEHVVNNVCKYTHYSDACALIIDSYGPQIIRMLEKRMTAQTICHEIGLCATNTSSHASARRPSLVKQH